MLTLTDDIVPKEETEAMEINSDDEDVAVPAVQPQETTTAKTRERGEGPLPSKQGDVSIVFLLPRTDTLIDIARLPKNVQTELQRRFYETCTTSAERSHQYHRILRLPHNRLDKEDCIRCQFTKTGVRGRRTDGYYVNGGEDGQSADDMCIEHRCSCVHMVRHNGVCTFCIVPLPTGLRVGKTWDELEYWVTVGIFVL
jgi:hypothetical protein